jgi:cellulose synthase/poly-beta-1,6-N-acetylglucosamine synthase-like glycosyltransferase
MHDRMNFPSRKLLVQEHIPNMLTKLIQWHVLQTIAHCATIIAFFYCQMSKIRYDTFVVVTFILSMKIGFVLVTFILSMKIGCLITLQALKLLTFLTWIEQVDYLLVKCQLTNNIITYIENNDANFNPYYCLLL